MEEYLHIFKEHELELNVLRDLSDVELKDVLRELGFTLGKQLKIIQRLKQSRVGGKINTWTYLICFF